MGNHIVDTNKMVPWAGEPPPLVDAIWISDMPDEKAIDEVCDLAVRFERRMRAAERLLERCLELFADPAMFVMPEVEAHLEAVRKEDGQ